MKALVFMGFLALGLGLPGNQVYKPSEEQDTEEHGAGPAKKSTSCLCGVANRASGRIVGGREARVNQFPWMVGLSRGNYFVFCGGGLISPWHVLTAAHCTVGEFYTPDLSVVIGLHSMENTKNGPEIITVEKAINHPQYDEESDFNDISLLKLSKSVKFSSKVSPVCLPTSRNDFNLVDKYIKAMGWGHTVTDGFNSMELLHTNLRIVPLNKCEDAFKEYVKLDRPTQLCTYSPTRDTCQGDSGGPLVYLDPDTNRYTLVGLVSYGRECAAGTPGVNTDVAAYLTWIHDNIKATSINTPTCHKV